MGKFVWIAVCLFLSGFRVSAMGPSMLSYGEEENENQVLPHRDGSCFTTTVRGKLKSGMPEFAFDIEACFDRKNSRYNVKSVTVRDGEEILQTISVPELSCFGETAVWPDQEENMGLELEDVNFDGYKDIRLFDTPNGNYRLEWIYLVWNPETEQFDHDPRLNEISLADFDQEEQLIYGMERDGAIRHYYYTYQYLDGEPVKIREEREIYLGEAEPEIVRRCLDGTGVSEEEVEICRETVWERRGDTGEMEQTQDEFVFYLSQGSGSAVMRVRSDSDMGELLSGEEE